MRVLSLFFFPTSISTQANSLISYQHVLGAVLEARNRFVPLVLVFAPVNAHCFYALYCVS